LFKRDFGKVAVPAGCADLFLLVLVLVLVLDPAE
jgi:hypothetical protein